MEKYIAVCVFISILYTLVLYKVGLITSSNMFIFVNVSLFVVAMALTTSIDKVKESSTRKASRPWPSLAQVKSPSATAPRPEIRYTSNGVPVPSNWTGSIEAYEDRLRAKFSD